MKSIVCTLFEGNYGKGVGAFVNSLYKFGFSGAVYAGYRGALPDWANEAKESPAHPLGEVKTMRVGDKIDLHFVLIKSNYHLTNYKPDFMISIISLAEQNADAMFYFDPDILLERPWENMETWVNCGIALCEDINSPLAQYHPIRVGWRKYFSKFNLTLSFKSPLYANGGFTGLKKDDFYFLHQWKKVQELMAPEIGGLDKSILGQSNMSADQTGAFSPFAKTDQDALNATVELAETPVSFLSKDAMGFDFGLNILPHALGRPKPWDITPLSTWIKKGKLPKFVDRVFWDNVQSPIRVYPESAVSSKKMQIKIALSLGRFYKK